MLSTGGFLRVKSAKFLPIESYILHITKMLVLILNIFCCSQSISMKLSPLITLLVDDIGVK